LDSHVCGFVFYLQESEKTTVVAEQVDEYMDIEDEMPTATYQSVEIEKDAEVVSVWCFGQWLIIIQWYYQTCSLCFMN
jgi:hypothetical protein